MQHRVDACRILGRRILLQVLGQHIVERRRHFRPCDARRTCRHLPTAHHRAAQCLRQRVRRNDDHVLPDRKHLLGLALGQRQRLAFQRTEVQVSWLPVPRVATDGDERRVLLRQLVGFLLRPRLPLRAVDFRRALLHLGLPYLELRRTRAPRLIGLRHLALRFAQIHQQNLRCLVQLKLPTDLGKEPRHRRRLATLPLAPEPCQRPLAGRRVFLVGDPDMRDPDFLQVRVRIGVRVLPQELRADLILEPFLPFLFALRFIALERQIQSACHLTAPCPTRPD